VKVLGPAAGALAASTCFVSFLLKAYRARAAMDARSAGITPHSLNEGIPERAVRIGCRPVELSNPISKKCRGTKSDFLISPKEVEIVAPVSRRRSCPIWHA